MNTINKIWDQKQFQALKNPFTPKYKYGLEFTSKYGNKLKNGTNSKKSSFSNSLNFFSFCTKIEEPVLFFEKKNDPFITKRPLTFFFSKKRTTGDSFFQKKESHHLYFGTHGTKLKKFYKISQKIKQTIDNNNKRTNDLNLAKNTTDFDLFFKKFTNLLMIDGKKIKASKILFNMLRILKKRLKKDVLFDSKFDQFGKEKENGNKIEKLEKDKHNYSNKKLENLSIKEIQSNFTLLRVISKALENLVPNLEVRKVRVAGSTYIVPAVLSKKKQETLALKWIIESAKKRQKNSKLEFSVCLADEMLEASRKSGQARQKRDELHRLAQMNRAYSRYRWW